MRLGELLSLAPFHEAMACSPGICETTDPEWSDYVSIEGRGGAVVIEAVHTDQSDAVCLALNSLAELFTHRIPKPHE